MLRGAAVWIILAVSLAAQDMGSVEGRLINSSTRAGIPGATVTITAASGTRYAYNATTDRTGAFRVIGIPPGSYIPSFRADGFVNAPPRDPAMRILSVMPGSPVRLTVEMVPFAKISGRVLDAAGNPAANVHVEIMHPYAGSGIVSGSDARGYFEASVPAGKYTLMARPVQKGVNLEKGVRPEDLMKLVPPPDDGERKAWAPTWYPNALEHRNAELIFARGGMDLSGYDIRFRAVSIFKVRGVVFDPQGKPAGGVTVRVRTEGVFGRAEDRTVSAPDGTFELSNVRTGSRYVTATTEDERKWYGVADISVVRSDLDDLQVRLSSRTTLTGRVEGGSGGPLSVYFVPSGWPVDEPIGGSLSDGTLSIRNVIPGRYRIRVGEIDSKYYLESIRLGEQDVLRSDVELNDSSPPIRIVLRSDPVSVRGTVENCEGAIVMFLPQDEILRSHHLFRAAPCDASGRFEVTGLRPGDYYAFAFDRVDGNFAFNDAAFVNPLLPRAVRVQARKGESAVVDLKVTPWPE